MTASLCISSDHPALPGHFPGAPVIPAVVIIDTIVARQKIDFPQFSVVALRKIRFLTMLKPDAQFQLEWSEIRGDQLRFRCSLDGAVFADGTLIVVDTAASQTPMA